MGFKSGAYATIWSVEPVTEFRTKVRLSTSRKNKETGVYDTDFSGFVDFIGANAAKAASDLKERDRIKIGDTEVTTKYDKEKNVTYTNFKIFSFEKQDGFQQTQVTNNVEEQNEPQADENDLPF